MDGKAKIANMPDIANSAQPQIEGALDWVGMNRIELPLTLVNPDGGATQSVAQVSAYVDLADPEARGIHMSRLYLHLDRNLAERPLTPCGLRHLLRDFLESHQGLSGHAMVRLDFDYMLRRKSLVSENTGWKRYPVSVIATLNEHEFALELGVRVLYSSTCPCSAALSRSLIQEQFDRDFEGQAAVSAKHVREWLGSDQGIMATPHSQRSAADVRVHLATSFEAFPVVELIDKLEDALMTPVQAAVKREDEQAFARLNGQNLMFCEDAARRVQKVLEAEGRVLDFWARCRHFESLHPHDAVAIVTKGVKGGYKPIDGQPSGWHD